MKTAIIDWGIGGLDLYKSFQSRFKFNPDVYISDSGFTPYGKLSHLELSERLKLIFHWLEDNYGIERIFIGCHSASAAWLETGPQCSLEIIEIISPTVRFLNTSSYKRILVIGGEGTISSGIYPHLISSDKQVVQIPTQKLSALIELGEVLGEKIEQQILEYLGNDLKHKTDALALCCTHYPAALDVFQKLYQEVTIINPVDHLRLDLTRSFDIGTKFLTTGSPQKCVNSAFSAFHLNIESFQKVSL